MRWHLETSMRNPGVRYWTAAICEEDGALVSERFRLDTREAFEEKRNELWAKISAHNGD